jgi:hypothetical protein
MPLPDPSPCTGGARRRRLLAGALLCLPLALAHAQTSALHPAGPSAAAVKAAFLLKFFNYVEWPAQSFGGDDAPYLVGVLGDDGVAAELQRQAAGHSFNGRPINVRRIGAELPAGAHMLFIGAHAERARMGALLRDLRGTPVLLVTDADGALDQGSMINFRLVDDRVRFEVALDPVRRANLQLNSRLLSVAIAVNKGTGQ